jgi:alpha-mannosidase
MNTRLRRILTTLVAMGAMYGALAQTAPDEFAHIKPLKGYVRSISGETLDYNCFNPLATSALLTRCTSGKMKIEWDTEPIPADAKDEYVYFKWIASYSTMTSAGDRSFNFFINNQKTFVIRTRNRVNEKLWSVKADDGSTLTFQFVKEDAARDANGYMYLKVPVARFKKGEPLRLQIVGEKANSSDWMMVFTYDLRTVDCQVIPLPYLTRSDAQLQQTVCVAIAYLGDKGSASISLDNGKMEQKNLVRGSNSFEFQVPAVETPGDRLVHISIDGAAAETITTTLKPVMKRTIYLLPHAHNDIGYTDIQTDVLKKHVKNIYDALDLIQKTASYPPEARFKWNIEVIWAVETFMENATEAKRKEFLDALRNGSITLEALYVNVLTGIMRPEEFFRVTEYARSFKDKYGIAVTSAMISDVPGMTWNMIPTLAQAGIKYFSSGPNGPYTGGDRTGHTNRSWADRPFYWASPSGNERILYWQAGFGYGSFFAGISAQNVNQLGFLKSVYRYFEWLDEISYPYDMIQMRHTIKGDNGPVDPDLPEFVKNWNETHVSPKIVIATTETLFKEFEQKYGAVLPAFAGDFTPYWEDGAASTAYELGVNRTTAEHLIQTEALAAIIAPAKYDPAAFYNAWKNVLLWDEHTWGAHNSISDPDSSFAVKQWEIKQRFAMDGARGSATLRNAIVNAPLSSTAVEVINTNSWERSDLVTLPHAQSAIGDVVTDEAGKSVPSQRLANGDLAFLAPHVPALGAKRYTLHAGRSSFSSSLTIAGGMLSDGNLQVTLDTTTGTIIRLKTIAPAIEFVDAKQGRGLNEYLYVSGLDAREALKAGKTTVAIKERGPLVASFVAASDAPGCNSLTREVRMVSGMGRVDLINTIDKQKVRSKEAVHFGFPFAVPEGVVRIDLGFGVIRPESDQLPGSCKDYFSAQRWVDVSNQEYGMTLTVAEAPLVEVGELHNELPSPRNVEWRTTQCSSPHLASYVMNNYWHTNYKADQEGVSTYHYSLIPHGLYNQAGVTRTGIERSQPLIARLVTANDMKPASPFEVSPGGIIVTYVKPINDGHGYLVRLFNCGGSPEVARLTLAGKAKSMYLSNPWEEKREAINAIDMPAYGIVTVRIE